MIGASRTDSASQLLGNVAVFDTEARMPAEKMAYALNSRLPEDIRVQQSFRVDDQFHPRKTSCIKTYEYRILNREFELARRTAEQPLLPEEAGRGKDAGGLPAVFRRT